MVLRVIIRHFIPSYLMINIIVQIIFFALQILFAITIVFAYHTFVPLCQKSI